MKLKFWKMSGAGNDFVCLDNRSGRVKLTKRQREVLCDRHEGIGADGLLILEKPTSRYPADARMRYYNADGGEAEMCGNGARCFARFVQRATRSRKQELEIQTKAGRIGGRFLSQPVGHVEVDLTPPDWPPQECRVRIAEIPNPIFVLNTGVPHAVVFVDDVENLDIVRLGALIRYDSQFAPAGLNANFVEVRGNSLIVRTYERGVEDETLACGTGVTAVALVAHSVLELTSPVDMTVRSGKRLRVSFQSEGQGVENVRLSGPAEFIYEGEIDV